MFVLAAILALATGAAGVPMRDGRIVGGKATTIEKYPHQVSLETSGQHFCSGSLLTSNYVVTAAQCVWTRNVSDISVRAATTNRTDGIVVGLEKFACNPKFDFSKLYGDVAVLKLKTHIPLNNKAKAIVLVVINHEPRPNTMLTVTGWGATTFGGNLSAVLQVVEVPAIDKEQCRLAYGNGSITDTMICAGSAEKGFCQGDSGGPLITSKRILVGIVSWGKGCGSPGFPGVYTNIASPEIHNFITNFTKSTLNYKDDEGELPTI